MKLSCKLFAAVVAALFFAKGAAAQTAPSDSVFLFTQKMPEFPGGHKKVLDYLIANVKMPPECRKAQVGGTTVVEFVVEKDGAPSSFKIATSTTERYLPSEPEKAELAKLLDAEAIRLASQMPKWAPGQHDGQPVRVRMRLPVKFTIY